MNKKEYGDYEAECRKKNDKLKGLLYTQVELIAKKSQRAGAVKLVMLSNAMCKILDCLEKIS